MAYTTATLTGTYLQTGGTPAEGTIEIIPNSRQIVDPEGDVILSGRVKVALDEAGSFSVVLPATDDATLEPAAGRQYTVVAKLRHAHLAAVTGVELAGGTTVDVADVASAPETDPTVTNAATTAQLAALETTVTDGLAGKLDTTAADATVEALVEDTSPSLARAALDAAFVGVTTPEKHGAALTYSAATDETAAVQAALTEAAGAGKVLYLRRMYNVPNGGLTSTGPVTIKGIGGMPVGDPVDTLTPLAKSGIRVNHATAVALTLTDAPGSLLEDFAVINDRTTAPTAGCGIKFSGDGASSQSNLNRVSVIKFYDGVETSGVFWTANQCRFYDSVRYGLYLNNTGVSYYDHGDLGVLNCVFAQNYSTWQCGSALRWRSGGGLRIIGNKFLGGVPVGNPSALHFDYCLDLMAADGVNTGDVTCTGNSISNMSVAAIRLGLEGTTGGFINTSIVGNLINVGYASAKAAVIGAPGTAQKNQIRCVHIADNIIDNMPGGGIYAFNMKALTVGVNTWQNMPTTLPVVSLGDAPDNGTGLEFADIARQNSHHASGHDLIKDLRRLNNALGLAGTVEHEFTQNLYANVVGTWVTLGSFDIHAVNGGSAELELLLTGYDFGVGPMFARYRRILTKVANNATVTVTTDGTDTTAGAGNHYAVQFLTTTQNRVIVQVQLTTGSPTIWGRAHLKALGDIEKSHRGA